MKNLNKKIPFFSLLAIGIYILGTLPAYAQSIHHNNQETQLSITENTYSLLALENNVSKISAFKVKSVEGDFSQIKINGYSMAID